jgi:phosphoenolpyruvate---glycerone phosphotransferase subunit DhaM
VTAVGLLLVSHSVRLAQGTAELAREMAPDVPIACAAGDVDGGLGTSLEIVTDALATMFAPHGEASGVASVVVLADLGSAVLTVESALELDDELAPRVRLASAPFVEGAVAAATTAQQGADLLTVVDAAQGAVESIGPRPVVEPVETEREEAEGPAGTRVEGEAVGAADPLAGGGVVTAEVEVRNPLGLHARPAALVAKAAASFGIPVRIQGVDATSVLQLMALGTTAGTRLEISAQGERATDAVAMLAGLIEGGFGEA